MWERRESRGKIRPGPTSGDAREFKEGGRVVTTRLEASPPQKKTRGGFAARVCLRATARSVASVASRVSRVRGRRDVPGVARIGTGGIHRSRGVETRRQARLHPSAATWISRKDALLSHRTQRKAINRKFTDPGRRTRAIARRPSRRRGGRSGARVKLS